MTNDKDKITEEGGPDQSWIVTFSDCMTLLLCFFVLLLSFSSFEEQTFEELVGAFHSMSYDWIRDNKAEKRDSFHQGMEQPENQNDGSVVPTDFTRTDSTQPPVEMLDMDIDKDQTVFYLPSEKIFWAKGISMTQDGRKFLATFAKYMTLVPCRVIIAESHGQTSRDLGLRRAWAVMRFFVQQRGIGQSRFSLSEKCDSSASRFAGKAFLKITMLNARIDE